MNLFDELRAVKYPVGSEACLKGRLFCVRQPPYLSYSSCPFVSWHDLYQVFMKLIDAKYLKRKYLTNSTWSSGLRLVAEHTISPALTPPVKCHES